MKPKKENKPRSVCHGYNPRGYLPNRYHLGTLNPHECPFRAEIDNDNDFKCNCCKKCQAECAADI